MNIYECDIMNALDLKSYINQRSLSEVTGHSIGVVNRSIKNLTAEGYLSEEISLTDKAKAELKEKSPRNAIILAAGFGMRMVPINSEMPKGLIEVNGEPLIERLIKQLHEVGIKDIYVVVGFMKECYEYLIDDYGVELVVNDEYALKNNLHSLNKVLKYISNSYIIPCDIWCKNNPFNKNELYSWYMVSDAISNESNVRVNRKMELVSVPEYTGGNTMIGISYILEDTAKTLKANIESLCMDARNDGAFWEQALYEKNHMILNAKVMKDNQIYEINTYEQLRELDNNSNQLKSDAIDIIKQSLNVEDKDITDITVLKKGMTNRSFLFSCKGKKYIMRIPGEGSDLLVNRQGEAAVYNVIHSKGICDDLVYINADNGYKITEYIENARVCDAFNVEDVKKCVTKLRDFHNRNMKVDHEFDLFEYINFYEKLRNGNPSVYRDYNRTKENVFTLKAYIDSHIDRKVLTHIDSNPDNFLLSVDDKGNEDIRLIDWEYAAMQDPHVDIAMFCIYVMYDRKQIDNFIDLYFEGKCPIETRIKVYCYISVCGLLWSNWCEYKSSLGIEFGEYSLRQYRYAKEYYKIAMEEIRKMEDE